MSSRMKLTKGTMSRWLLASYCTRNAIRTMLLGYDEFSIKNELYLFLITVDDLRLAVLHSDDDNRSRRARGGYQIQLCRQREIGSRLYRILMTITWWSLFICTYGRESSYKDPWIQSVYGYGSSSFERSLSYPGFACSATVDYERKGLV
jgi:hypothetical protein